MNTELQSKLDQLRIDYTDATGKSFNHFFCPLLFRDESTKLCKGHIINQAFPNSSRKWTVQREDLDNFYGSKFEADFSDIRFADKSPEEILTDRMLSNKFKPRILVNDKEIKHFPAKKDIYSDFTPLEVENDGKKFLFGLKIQPQDFLKLEDQKWELDTTKSLKIPSIASLTKAAHLTLFEILGYRYALGVTGRFVGYDILGKFFIENHQKSKSEVIEPAIEHFGQYIHTARVVKAADLNLQGTITDKIALLCKGYSFNATPWAFIIFVKTSEVLNAVIIPTFARPDAIETYLNFLANSNETIEVNYCQYEGDHWSIDRDSFSMVWPKTGAELP